jgi:BMFP domain-containing protein YqiC
MRLALLQHWTSRIVLFVLIGALVLLGFAPKVTAQYSNLDVRLSRIEAENSQLRSRISQLERAVSRGGSISRAPQRSPNAEIIEGPVSSDPMFDRLATLFIELRERVDTLEAQVAELRGQ